MGTLKGRAHSLPEGSAELATPPSFSHRNHADAFENDSAYAEIHHKTIYNQLCMDNNRILELFLVLEDGFLEEFAYESEVHLILPQISGSPVRIGGSGSIKTPEIESLNPVDSPR